MFRTLTEARRFINRATDYERMSAPYSPSTYNLDRMRRLVEALGHPERAFRSVHIAGTKGKGSVALMAEAILRGEGYRTGLYTSPHLLDMLERIQLDGRPVGPADFVWAMNRMERALRRLRPTYFELMTAAAFVIFARRRVDWAVIEVGLGGRLDATNVIHPAACAITPIDYDHTDKLGRTLGAIAGEKAGIVKPGVPVVTGPQRPAALRVLRRVSDPFRPKVRLLRSPAFVLNFQVEGVRGRYRGTLRALGSHQASNAGTAIALVEAAGVRLRPQRVRRSLGAVRLPGRIEIVSRRPWGVVDVAHNAVAARALAAALGPLSRRRLILVFGASADKDWKAMLRTLVPMADLTILTRADTPRAADPRELARHVRRGRGVVAPRVAAAVKLARTLAGPADAVVVTGSFYVAGEALAVLHE